MPRFCPHYMMVCLALTLGCLPVLMASQAVVKQVTGKAGYKLTQEATKWEELKADSTLEQGTWVRTGEQASVVLAFGDDAVVTINEMSTVWLKSLASEQRNIGVEAGEVWNKVRKTEGKFTIFTPAAVAAVRGTEFFVSSDPQTKTARIGVWDGTVAVISPKDRQTVVDVTTGQVVEVLFNQVPKKPVALEAARLRQQAQFNQQVSDLGLAAVMGGKAIAEGNQALVDEAEGTIKSINAQKRGEEKIRETDFPTLKRAMARLFRDTQFILGKGRRIGQGKATLLPLAENKDYDGQPIAGWKGPYIESNFLDPFGGSYVIYEKKIGPSTTSMLTSFGLDKLPNSEDDVVTPISQRALENELKNLPD